MPRTDNKAAKIAFDLLGIPNELRAKPFKGKAKPLSEEDRKRLVFEETTHVR